jgi:ribonuclease G
MGKKILFNATPTEKRAALLEDGKLVELVVERPDQFRIVGNIYRGKILSILPGIQAAFVDIGLERSAFLHASDVDPSVLLEQDDVLIERYTDQSSERRKVPKIPIEKVIDVGQEILVQVLKEPIGTKGAKVTTQISLAGRFLVLVPDADFIGVSKKTHDFKTRRSLKRIISELKPPGVGFIVRTIGLEVSETEFIKEIHDLLDKWRRAQEEALRGSSPKLVHREQGITTSVIRDLFSKDVQEVIVDTREDMDEISTYVNAFSPELVNRIRFYTDKTPLFDKFNIEKELERSLRRKVWLKCGGYILFDHTEALLAIDVNTGRNVGKADLDQTIFTTNSEAADEIARQLRLRDIGGLIVVDFIDMNNPDHRHSIEEQMRVLMQQDATATSTTGLSKFCLMEMTRKRVRPELRELYSDICPTCNGLGWIFSPASVSSTIDHALQRISSQRAQLRELVIHVHPTVVEYLHKDKAQMIRKLEQEHGIKLEIFEDVELDPEEYAFYQRVGGKLEIIKL